MTQTLTYSESRGLWFWLMSGAFANAFHEDIGLDLSLLFPLWLESGLGPCHAGRSERIMVLFFKRHVDRVVQQPFQKDYFIMEPCFIVIKQDVVDWGGCLIEHCLHWRSRLSPFQWQITERMLRRFHLEIVNLHLQKNSWMSIFSGSQKELNCGEWGLYLRDVAVCDAIMYFLSHITCGCHVLGLSLEIKSLLKYELSRILVRLIIHFPIHKPSINFGIDSVWLYFKIYILLVWRNFSHSHCYNLLALWPKLCSLIDFIEQI